MFECCNFKIIKIFIYRELGWGIVKVEVLVYIIFLVFEIYGVIVIRGIVKLGSFGYFFRSFEKGKIRFRLFNY